MSQPKLKVAVYVSGGVVTQIITDAPQLVDCVVVDLDDGEAIGLNEEEAAAAATFADGSSVAELDQSLAVW